MTRVPAIVASSLPVSSRHGRGELRYVGGVCTCGYRLLPDLASGIALPRAFPGEHPGPHTPDRGPTPRATPAPIRIAFPIGACGHMPCGAESAMTQCGLWNRRGRERDFGRTRCRVVYRRAAFYVKFQCPFCTAARPWGVSMSECAVPPPVRMQPRLQPRPLNDARSHQLSLWLCCVHRTSVDIAYPVTLQPCTLSTSTERPSLEVTTPPHRTPTFPPPRS